MKDMQKARREIEILIRALQQDKNPDAFERILMAAGIEITTRAKKNVSVDRGMLRRSIDYRLVGSDTVEIGVFGNNARNVPYAQLHELGGTITAKKTRFLAIPLENQYRDRSPRDFATIVYATIGGKTYLVDRATGKAAYRLVKSVKREAKPYLKPAFEDFIKNGLNKLLEDWFKELD